MVAQIAPSILSLDLTRAHQVVTDLIQVGAKIIHLDIMDGHFVPPITFGPQLVQNLPKNTDVLYEAHLMVSNPQNQFDAFIEAGCQRIIFHQEVAIHSSYLIHQIKKRGCQVGIAINPGTSPELIKPLLQEVDLVLVMTVNPGWGGQTFISSCLDKVKQIKDWSPSLVVEIDGGVDEKIVPLALKTGAEIMVVGSRFLDPKGYQHVWNTLKSAI